MKRVVFSRIRVFASPRDPRLGWLCAGHVRVRCALGRSGPTRFKREGDGATPVGAFPLFGIFHRPDKGPRPRTVLPTRPIAMRDGWCDAPRHRLYNRLVRLPFDASHEEMWRSDDMYDLVLDIGWNRGRGRERPFAPQRGRPRAAPSPRKPLKGMGSAIFMHLARPGYSPTAGCVALDGAALRRLVPRIGPRTRLVIG
ncbi:MAG: L,D-transpeptidase catalytic domain protein [Salinarimonadaceae bacterium]|nr:MAG: L,D-transpeptidase catalytic domain protein [Salinarimonadaceae bacterium]